MAAADPIEWIRSLFIQVQQQQRSLPFLQCSAVGFTAGMGTCSAVIAGFNAVPAPPPPVPADIFLQQIGLEGVLYQPSGSIPPPSFTASAKGVQLSTGTVPVTQILAGGATSFTASVVTCAPVQANTIGSVAPPIPVEWIDSLFAQLPYPQLPSPPNVGAANDSQAALGIAAPTQIYKVSATTVGRGLGVSAGALLNLQSQPPQMPAEWMLTLFLAQPKATSAAIQPGSSTSVLRGVAKSAATGVSFESGAAVQVGTAAASPMGVGVGTAPYIQRGMAVAAPVNVLQGFSAPGVQRGVGTAPVTQQSPITPTPVLPAEIVLGQWGFDAIIYQPPQISTIVVVAGTANWVNFSPAVAGAQVVVIGGATTVQRGTAKAAVVLGSKAFGAQRSVVKATPASVAMGHAVGLGHQTGKSSPITICISSANGKQRSIVTCFGNAVIHVVTITSQHSTYIATGIGINPSLTHLAGLVSPFGRSGVVSPRETAGVS